MPSKICFSFDAFCSQISTRLMTLDLLLFIILDAFISWMLFYINSLHGYVHEWQLPYFWGRKKVSVQGLIKAILWPNYHLLLSAQFSSWPSSNNFCMATIIDVFEILKLKSESHWNGTANEYLSLDSTKQIHFMRFRSLSTARCHILRKRLNSLHFVIKWPLSITFIRCYRSILRCNNQVINWLYD